MNINELYDNTFSVGRSNFNKFPGIYLDVIPDDNFEISSSDEVNINYSFSIDHRSWGIKDINININSDIKFVVEIDGSEIAVVVPVDKINISWVAGRSYVPVGLYVTIDRKGNVKFADLNVSYIEH